MRTKLIYPIFVLLTISILSCKKELPNDPLAIKDLSVSGCKSKNTAKNIFGAEYITLKTIDDFYIQLDHINSIFNCEPGQITVTINVSSDVISMDENESSSAADCICPNDLSFKLGPLQYGTYFLNFQKGGLTFKEYTLDFNKSTDIKIDL